tara:strand:- start:849 stop:1934 length:1086 start_codon:yes stop_codon:yes gene_type:complete
LVYPQYSCIYTPYNDSTFYETLASSGSLSLGTSAGTDRSISGEFGGSTPHALSEYYAGGSYVASGTGSIPSSGAIDFSDFHGTSQGVIYVHTSEDAITDYGAQMLPNTSARYASYKRCCTGDDCFFYENAICENGQYWFKVGGELACCAYWSTNGYLTFGNGSGCLTNISWGCYSTSNFVYSYVGGGFAVVPFSGDMYMCGNNRFSFHPYCFWGTSELMDNNYRVCCIHTNAGSAKAFWTGWGGTMNDTNYRNTCRSVYVGIVCDPVSLKQYIELFYDCSSSYDITCWKREGSRPGIQYRDSTSGNVNCKAWVDCCLYCLIGRRMIFSSNCDGTNWTYDGFGELRITGTNCSVFRSYTEND